MADLTIDQLPEATSISNDDIMIVAAANSSTAKKIKASLVVGRPSPGSGHVIVDGNGSDMPQRPNLQFAGETVSVVDDPTLGRTVVEVAGSELKPATTTTLGGVIVGKNIEVDAEGVISTLGGHTIQNPDGVALEQQPNLQFTGDFVTATDQAASERTVVDVTVPLATTQKPGIVQVGGGIDVDDAGVVSTVRGHEVVDPEGNIMAQEDQIQFTGDAVRVTDDPTAKRTTVDVTVPFATVDNPGIVQVGEGINVNDTGVISVAGVEPPSYFPANASMDFWSTSISPIVIPSGKVVLTAKRFYAAHFNDTTGSTQVYKLINALSIRRSTAGVFKGTIAIIYPMGVEESAQFAGKKVTFSFVCSCSSPSPAGAIYQFAVKGIYRPNNSFSQINSIGDYPLMTGSPRFTLGPEELVGVNNTRQRYSVTFDMPANLTQISLQWLVSGTQNWSTSSNIVNISEPRIDIGGTALPYVQPGLAATYDQVQKTQPTIGAAYLGPVTEGVTAPIGAYYQFPSYLEGGLPTVINAVDSSSPVNFSAATTGDLTALTNTGCVIARTPSVAAGSGTVPGSYRSIYLISTPYFIPSNMG